jgi:6-phosphofructokinase 1
MGRNTGWIAAGTGLARREDEDAPHLIYIPERPRSLTKIAEDIQACIRKHKRCFISVSEGARDENGQLYGESSGDHGEEEWQHAAGVGEVLRSFVERELGVKCRTNKIGTAQRTGMHFASLVDVNEAFKCGTVAVRKAVGGQSGQMVTLIREEGPVYRCSMGMTPLSEVSRDEKPVPDEFINEEGTGITRAMKDYLRPLTRGEAPINIGADGLPVYVRLAKRYVPKQLAQWGRPGGA